MTTLRAWLLRASPPRVAIEVGVLLFVTTLPFALVFAGAPEQTRWAVLGQSTAQFGLFAGLLGALRLRQDAEPRRRRLGRRLTGGAAVVAGAWLGGSAAVVAGLAPMMLSTVAVLFAAMPEPEAVPAGIARWPATAEALIWGIVMAVTVGGFAGATSLIAFLVSRGVVLTLQRWNRMRRTRLRWALTHSLLVASLILAVIAATFLIAASIQGGSSPTAFTGILPEQTSRVGRALALITFQIMPSAIVLLLISLLAGIVVAPPVALIGFPMLGRATRRLEELTAATGAVRSGHLETRVPVAGEDEVARLQADFNAMAADLERTLNELRAERDAVARLLEARRQLVASVSHELRTPLATLRGYLDSALEHWEDGPPSTLHHDLEIMSAEAERLHRLIDDLFTLSRAEVGRLPLTLQPTAVDALLRAIAEAAAPLAWKRGRVEVVARTEDALPPALVDPERLEQVVRNLVTNAVRHTPPGGVVLLTAEPGAGEIVVKVRDTGEGILPADLPHVWERFFRASSTRERDRGGAGLGLALVKELTEAMSGIVGVESTPGEGSCFTIRLPLAPTDQRRTAVATAGQPAER